MHLNFIDKINEITSNEIIVKDHTQYDNIKNQFIMKFIDGQFYSKKNMYIHNDERYKIICFSKNSYRAIKGFVFYIHLWLEKGLFNDLEIGIHNIKYLGEEYHSLGKSDLKTHSIELTLTSTYTINDLTPPIETIDFTFKESIKIEGRK